VTESPDQSSGALILVIEDEDTQRLLTRDCLEEAGFRVEEAASGENTVSLLRALQPDLVLLDVMLPGIDGFEVCQQIRADREIGHTPVVLITGRDNTNDVKRGFSAGATDFFAKPVRWNLLPTRIEFVLRTSRLERDLRVAKEAAERASRAKSALLSTMGHELRTPLNAIIGFSELIRQEAYGPLGVPQYEEFIEDIHAAGSLLLNGINDVLDIVNSESGEEYTDDQIIDLSNLLQRVVATAGPAATAGDIRIINQVLPISVQINCDPVRLHQAISNLVANAVKFSPAGSTVRISAMVSADNEAILCVSDNGIGIQQQDLERIMNPFEQADSSLSRRYEGMGLGLSLSLAVVRLHGGDLSLTSKYGQGTDATITLPSNRVRVVVEGNRQSGKSAI
jgi:signal transduction histidine kinase